MYLKNLHLRSFRNYAEQQVIFSAPKTILLGNNAQGKSNLLVAVELLSTLKSHRISRDRELVLDGAIEGQITAILERNFVEQELSLIVRKQGRRSVALNKENLRRQLDFLGVLNAVQFSSLDLELVRGSPESRRNWLDNLLIQLEPVYAHILQQYDRVLRQRNALLKEIRKQSSGTIDSNNLNSSQLQVWDEQLAANGSRVTRRRARVLERLAPIAQFWHSSISGKTEILELKYLPNVPWEDSDPASVQQAFSDKIKERGSIERQQGKTVVGTHLDEVDFNINNTPARYYGSQGQQRTLVLALKLAELQLIEQVIGEPPLLLLDDVLAELDPHRQNQLLEAIGDRFQTLITTTHINSFDDRWLQSSQILKVEAGAIALN